MKSLHKKSILGLTLLLSGFNIYASPSEGAKDKANENKKPNFVFFLSDDQDVYDYNCYDNEKLNTASVDQLVREGIKFNNAYTSQSICAPSRSQLYTGKLPLKNGCFVNHTSVRPDIKSVTHYLKELGYDVILAGKSHVGPKEVFDWTIHFDSKKSEDEKLTRLVIPLEEVKEYISKADKPYCIFLTSEFPHGPYPEVEMPNKEDITSYPFNKTLDDKFYMREAGYNANIKSDQEQLRDILGFIDENDRENTVFFYSSDHGISGKFSCYERGLRVPLAIRWQGVIKPGMVSDQFVQFIDVLPTMIDIAGGKVPKDMDGKSFLPILLGKEIENHKYIYGVQTNQNVRSVRVFPARSIRDKKYKYIRNFNSYEVVENNLGENQIINEFILRGSKFYSHKNTPFEELYDLENDPYELENLAKDANHKKIKEHLIKEMYKWMKEQDDFLTKENYMPMIYPNHHPLDKKTISNNIPKHLINSLKDEDYVHIHDLNKKGK